MLFFLKSFAGGGEQNSPLFLKNIFFILRHIFSDSLATTELNAPE